MKVLVACEFSGIVRDAFARLGHDSWSCDLLPSEKEGNHIQGDMRNLDYSKWDLLIVHPDCTYLTVTGNKWFLPKYHDRFPHREQDRKDAIEFFMWLTTIPVPKMCIENPVGIMSRIYKKPDQIIQPFQFGHSEPKKTCLWLKGLPLLTPTKIMEPEYIITKSGKRVPKWFFSPSNTPERKKLRKRTFQGIADAMASQWG